MYNVFTVIVLIITGLLIIFLLFLLSKQSRTDALSKQNKEIHAVHSICPLCGSGLTRSEKVKSVLFPGKPDSMMEIYGCPYCFPPDNKIKRICPVCKKELKKTAL